MARFSFCQAATPTVEVIAAAIAAMTVALVAVGLAMLDVRAFELLWGQV